MGRVHSFGCSAIQSACYELRIVWWNSSNRFDVHRFTATFGSLTCTYDIISHLSHTNAHSHTRRDMCGISPAQLICQHSLIDVHKLRMHTISPHLNRSIFAVLNENQILVRQQGKYAFQWRSSRTFYISLEL